MRLCFPILKGSVSYFCLRYNIAGMSYSPSIKQSKTSVWLIIYLAMQGYSIQIRFLLRTFHYFSVNTIHNLLFFFRSISGRVPGAVTVPVRTVILQSWSLHKGAGLTTIHQNLTIPGACLYAQMGCNIHQLAAQTVASNTHLGKHDFFRRYLTKELIWHSQSFIRTS